MDIIKPTKKQTQLLDFIRAFQETNDYSPSYREIAAYLGLKSVSAVAEHVDNCVSRGFLRKIPGAARSLEVIEPVRSPDWYNEITVAIDKLEDSPDRQETLKQALEILISLHSSK